jgi:hypothetical protein
MENIQTKALDVNYLYSQRGWLKGLKLIALFPNSQTPDRMLRCFLTLKLQTACRAMNVYIYNWVLLSDTCHDDST